jgi:hypothetical protein
MDNPWAVVVIFFTMLLMMFLVGAAIIDNETRSAACERKGGDWVRMGRSRYVCLKPGTVIE